MRKTTLLLLCLLSMSALQAQNQIKLFTNTQSIDPKRYEGVRGTPMIYKDWKDAELIDTKDSLYTGLKLNYNGFEEGFEIQRNSKEFIALNPKYYSQVMIVDENAPDGTALFKKSVHSRFRDKFVQIIYENEDLTLFKYIKVTKGEVTFQDVGETRTFENFKQAITYYILRDGKLKSVKLKKKSLLEALGSEKSLSSFIKKEKLKLSSDKDLHKLFAYYGSL